MYSVQSSGALTRAWRARRTAARRGRVSRTVVLLGACSLLTDVSSEMVATILPLYLVTTLGYSPIQYGVIDGLFQGAGTFVRLGAGYVGDRVRRHKPVAALGYGMSAICKLALAVGGSAWGLLSAVITVDRFGKGIRTAPRDAMISLASPRADLGLAFGVHRAMDTAGAMLGPLIAFLLLTAAPDSFQLLFLISFFVALLGFGVLVLLVDEPRPRPQAAERPDLAAAAGLLRDAPFRRLAAIAALLGLATVSDGFVYLTLYQQVGFGSSLFPLLATGTAVGYMLLAVPAGRLADRLGRGRVFLAGYVLLLAVYVLLITAPASGAAVIFVLALMGAYYAATDGVLMAIGGARLPEALRGSGLALLGTAASGARLIASVLFGALWTLAGLTTALMVFGGVLVVALLLAARGLRAVHA